MRLDAVPENLLERIALQAGVVPTPLGDTIVAMTLARTIMVATKLGVFARVRHAACRRRLRDVGILSGGKGV